jgi:hypothetical protein
MKKEDHREIENPDLPTGGNRPDEESKATPPAKQNPAEPETLPEQSRQRYRHLKERLSNAKKKQAEILYEIRSEELFRAEYETFGDFQTEEVGYGPSYTRRLIRWGWALKSTNGFGPTSESHCRPLSRIREDDDIDGQEAVRRIFEAIEERWGDVTRAHVQEVVDELYPAEDMATDVITSTGTEASNPGDDGETVPTGTGSADSGSQGPPSDSPNEDSLNEEGDHSDASSLGSISGPKVVAPAAVADSLGIGGDELHGGRRAVSASGLSHEALEEIEEGTETEEQPLSHSSGEEGIAGSIWRPITRGLRSFSSGLPPSGDDQEESDEPDDDLLLRPKRLGQITASPAEAEAGRVLVCPGLDLFSPSVPDFFVQAVLTAIEGTSVDPVIFTRHLGRATEFELSGLWVGTPAGRSRLEDKEQALSEAASEAAVRWILYDIENEDTEDPPSFSVETDWVVYDPPGGAGVSLTVAETQSLVEAAEDSGTDWSFRSAFETCGDSGPSEGSADTCSVGHSNEDSGPGDDPSGENGAV